MAMSNCKECGKEVSTLAKTCPSCGVPKPALKKKLKKNKEPNIYIINENIKDKEQIEHLKLCEKTYKNSDDFQIGELSYNKKAFYKVSDQLNAIALKQDKIKTNYQWMHEHWDLHARFPETQEHAWEIFFDGRKIHELEGIWNQEDWGVVAIVKEGNYFQKYAIDINCEIYSKEFDKYFTFNKLNGTRDGAFFKTPNKNSYDTIMRVCFHTGSDSENLGEQAIYLTAKGSLKVINENKLLEKTPKTKSFTINPTTYTRLWPKRIKSYNKEGYKNTDAPSSNQVVESNNSASNQKDDFQKFIDGEMDLATSFWGFLIVGTFIVGFVSGFLSPMIGSWIIIALGIYTWIAVQGTWASAEKYKAAQTKKKQSIVWGILAQIVCGLNVISTIGLLFETFS